MDDAVILKEFEKLAHRLGMEIRYTAVGPSGLCSVKGKQILFIDRSLDSAARIEMLVREFKTLNLEGMFVVPLIRRLLGDED